MLSFEESEQMKGLLDFIRSSRIRLEALQQKAAQSVKQCVWRHDQHAGADKLINGAHGGLVYQEVH